MHRGVLWPLASLTCNQINQCQCQSPPRRRRVVVVGAGLTGCLTAKLLRRSIPELDIEVWERATYPSGRFGAALQLRGHSDLGAQVLSVIEVDSGHPNAGADGHNLQSKDLCTAWDEVQQLVSQGWLRRASEEELADTEERMKYQGLWAHFWCPKGLSALLQHFLTTSSATLRWGRVQQVKTTGVSAELWATERSSRQQVRDEADLVILAVPAPEALQLCSFPADVAEALSQIRYDRRVAVGLVLEHATYANVEEAFKGVAEVALDLEAGSHSAHLISWQNMKQGAVAHGDAMRLVIHSTDGAEWSIAEALKTVSWKCALPLNQLQGLVLGSKVVDWQICQMVQPLEAISTGTFRLQEPCFQQGRILVAGDFWSQSSFLGCYCSAKAAVRQAVALLEEG